MRLSARLFVIPFALCWLLLLAGVPAAFAQKKRKTPELPPAPPPVVAREVSVLAGESVEVPLGIHGRRAEQLEFLVRNPPKAGKLSGITTTGANSAVVIYTAPPESPVTEDRFTYAARSSEGVSAPGIVTVKLMPKPVLPPRLTVPESVEFPRTLIGAQSTATLEISNPGGTTVAGEVTVTPPWRIEASPAYRIEPKGRATFKLLFRPEKPGMVSGEAVLGPNPRRVVALSAEGVPPFTVKPAQLRIPAAERGQTRMGTLEIENLSDEPQVVTFAANPRLMTEKTVELKARAKAQVPVFAEPGDGSGFEEVARLSVGDWKQDVTVEVEPLRPGLKLSAVGEGALRGIAGRPAEFSVAIVNEGGRAASATITATPPFASAEPKVTIGPGETKRVKIGANTLGEGEHRVEVTAETETAVQRLKLAYVAAPDPARPQPARTSRPIAPSLVAVAAAEAPAAQGEPAGEGISTVRETSSDLADHPNALGTFAQDIRTDRAALVWPATMGPATGFVVEERRLAFTAERKLAVTWRPMANVKIHSDASARRAELTELEPAKLYTVRVASGGQTLFTTQFTTKSKAPFFSLSWTQMIVGALLIVLGALVWRQWKNRRRSAW